MKTLICLFVLVIGLHYGYSMTEKQIKATTKLVRNNCQPKSKASDAVIENMHKGVWDEDDAAKMYMYCSLSFLKVANKKGILDLEEALKVVPQIPQHMQQPVEKALRECANAGDASTDKYDASWQIAKCIYFSNPEMYFLP